MPRPLPLGPWPLLLDCSSVEPELTWKRPDCLSRETLRIPPRPPPAVALLASALLPGLLSSLTSLLLCAFLSSSHASFSSNESVEDTSRIFRLLHRFPRLHSRSPKFLSVAPDPENPLDAPSFRSLPPTPDGARRLSASPWPSMLVPLLAELVL